MIARGLGNAAALALAFAAAVLAIGARLPFPEVPQVREKLAWLAAHRDRYSVLFLGTSRVRRHLIPALFDELMATHGRPLRSFNLGVDSLFSPEDAYVLEHALAATGPQLRYVFIEISYFRHDFNGQPPDSIRAAYWHDAPRTATILRRLATVEWAQIRPRHRRKRDPWSTWLRDTTACLGLGWRHLELAAQRATHLGRGSQLLQAALLPGPPRDPLAPLGPARDGFIPSTAEHVLRGPELSAFQQQIAELRVKPARALWLDPVAEQSLASMVAAVRRHGAQPILFTPPNPAGAIFLPRADLAPLLDFSAPHAFPALFEPAYRADAGHLNTAGAGVFTRALVERFLPIAEER